MSLYDYHVSLELAKQDVPFYALLMAAIRKADTDNLQKLSFVFPQLVAEFRARYNAPGGKLPQDDQPQTITLVEIQSEDIGIIKGIAATRQVFINGIELSPTRSQLIVNHSPDGFEWGYGGSGPAQLALAIALELVDENRAREMYQSFKQQFIARLEQGKDFELDIDRCKAFLQQGFFEKPAPKISRRF
jgi:hypothetical protein